MDQQRAYADFGAEFLDSIQGLTTLKAFGQIIKSLFILRYVDDMALRQAIENSSTRSNLPTVSPAQWPSGTQGSSAKSQRPATG